MAFLLQVRFVVVVVLAVTMILSQWCSLSEGQLNPVDAAALKDLCDRPWTDLWTNCNDSANACINSWEGVGCDYTNTSIMYMYVIVSLRAVPPLHSLPVVVYQRSKLYLGRRNNSGVDWESDADGDAVRLV